MANLVFQVDNARAQAILGLQSKFYEALGQMN